MQARTWILTIVAAGLALATMLATVPRSEAQGVRPAPAFTHTDANDWLNSPPLRWADLKGKLVLIDVWTFDCWNCYRSIPWLQKVEQKYRARGLQVIGVHTPELPQERIKANVVRRARELGFDYPIMIDNDASYWKALNNHYWPAFYLVDGQGQLRGSFIGETHVGDDNARQIEATIDQLLAEAKP